MKIYKLDTESEFEKLNLCLAIGNFDGIHKGHQEIINKIKEIASNNNLLSSIMSFNPHPRIFFNQINEPFNIYTQNDKINFLERLGLDIFIDFSFDNNLSVLSADDFVTKILINKLNICVSKRSLLPSTVGLKPKLETPLYFLPSNSTSTQ